MIGVLRRLCLLIGRVRFPQGAPGIRFQIGILILLGYNIRSWEMRVILQELIRDQPRRPRSVAIQIDPHDMPDIVDTDRFQEYMQMYLAQDKYRFDVYWGDTLSFLKQLWETWQGT